MNILRTGMPPGAPPIDTTDDAVAWLTSQGYRRVRSVAVTVKRDRVLLEVWRRSSAEDPIALYHPLIPDTSGTDSICLAANEDEIERLIDAARMMIETTLPLVQMQRQIKRKAKHGLN